MPKMTAEERAELEARLAADDADDEDDFEVTIKDGDKSLTGPYRKAKQWARDNFGIDLDAEPKQDPDEAEPPAKGGKATGTEGKVTAFQRRVR